MTLAKKFNFKLIQIEALYLVEEGFLGRDQPIYALALYMNFCQWAFVERELNKRNIRIGHRISNLIDAS